MKSLPPTYGKEQTGINPVKGLISRKLDSLELILIHNSRHDTITTIDADKLLDGVCVFVTNHIEAMGRGFKVNSRKVIRAYRDKTKIEDVFKNVKSFLKIRPFFVNTQAHVKAVYTICILAYFLNKFLANQRKAAGQRDYLNSKELYAPFKNIDFVTLVDPTSGDTVTKSV